MRWSGQRAFSPSAERYGLPKKTLCMRGRITGVQDKNMRKVQVETVIDDRAGCIVFLVPHSKKYRDRGRARTPFPHPHHERMATISVRFEVPNTVKNTLVGADSCTLYPVSCTLKALSAKIP